MAAPRAAKHATESDTPAIVVPAATSAATPATSETATPLETTPTGVPVANVASDAGASRTELNLLGQVDTSAGENRRNENVRITLIDNGVQRELNERLGTSATIVKEFKVESSYFGAEFGGSPSSTGHLTPGVGSGFHGNIYETHNNSIFSARSFFQVGGVKPARANDYGFTLLVPLSKRLALTLRGSRNRSRGNVNGNVLVPTPDERRPLTHDPATGEPVDQATQDFVRKMLSAYPDELPNRPDIDPRALNTNSPQSLDNDVGGVRLDGTAGGNDQLTLDYQFTGQDIEAFQLVGGQNPDTTTKNHRARVTWTRAWSSVTTTDFSIGFNRVGSLLVPEETAIGPLIYATSAINFIGPGPSIPLDRARNTYRYGGRLGHLTGRHDLQIGFTAMRRQINGFDSNGHRGEIIFGADFGNDAITNFRIGKALRYNIALGDIHRGFRSWDTGFFVADRWQASTNLTLHLGLRYQAAFTPLEVNRLNEIPYDCDCNNLAPRFGFAYRLGKAWGVLRGAYGVHYGEIYPVTYGQERFNPPGSLRIALAAAPVVDPLRELGPDALNSDARSTVVELDPNLVAPYSHQYNFQWELNLGSDWKLELGYVGSRSVKLLNLWNMNRARPVPGIEQSSSTVNERRPDQRYFEVRRVLNSSRGYYDAAKLRLLIPGWRRITLDTSYWFSKAIDLGGDYTNTGAAADAWFGQSQSEFDVFGEMRALSTFHQPHAFLTRLNYELPRPTGGGQWMGKLLGSWRFSSVILLKTGTPFTVVSGSDGPGFGNVDGTGRDRPNVLDPAVLGNAVDHPDTSRSQLPASAFTYIGPTQFAGTLGRNTFRKDAIANLNLAVSRRWAFGSDIALLLRAESINLTNTAQFAEPGRDLESSNFGKITNTLNDGRTFRFLLRFSF